VNHPAFAAGENHLLLPFFTLIPGWAGRASPFGRADLTASTSLQPDRRTLEIEVFMKSADTYEGKKLYAKLSGDD